MYNSNFRLKEFKTEIDDLFSHDLILGKMLSQIHLQIYSLFESVFVI